MFRSTWVAAIAAVVTAGVSAQTWPERALTVVVPYGAGGNTDLIARVVAEKLGQALKQPVVVENRPGAAGLIAARAVASAKPDGYTLFMGTASQIVTAPFVYTKVNLDPIKEFAPIINIGANPFVLTVGAQVPATSLSELLTHAKLNAGKLSYGSGGNGTITHLASYLFLRTAGIDMIHVPYKGASAAMNDLLGGQIDMYSASPSEVIPQRAGGKVRLLAVSSASRLKQLPDVPTIAETFPGHEVVSWNGLLAPAGTPPQVLDRIALEVGKLAHDPATQKKLEEAGISTTYTARAAFAAQIAKETALWGAVLKNSNIKAD